MGDRCSGVQVEACLSCPSFYLQRSSYGARLIVERAIPGYDVVFIALVVWGIKTHLSSFLRLHGYLSYSCYDQDHG